MSGQRRRHLTLLDCQVLAQSTEGSSSLSQPFSQRRTSRDLNRGLYPRYQTARQRTGRGLQSRITDYFTRHVCQTQGAHDMESQRAEKLEVTDALQDDGERSLLLELDCAELFDEETKMGPSEPTLFGKRHFSSRWDSSQDMGQARWGGNAKKPLLDCSSQLSSELRTIIDDDDDEPIDVYSGLLGTPGLVLESPAHISQLPDELLMRIFAFLPVVDLYRNISVVCQHWRAVVSDPLFVPWKKLYHRFLRKEEEAVRKVEGILTQNCITKQEDLCVLNLLRFIASFKYIRSMDPEAVIRCLKGHRLYVVAEACITQRLPELSNPAGAANVWAVMATIVLFSDSVSDIQKVLACLRRPSSTLVLSEVTEILYCIATLLFAMREKEINISNRIHYNVFYCLNLLENAGPVCGGTSSVQSRSVYGNAGFRAAPEIKLTHEQHLILNHDICRRDVAKIVAFAGTGKTFTLVKYAERRPKLRFLYAAFNKSIVEQAKRTFPSNVACKTFHALAFAQKGRLFRQKMVSKITPYMVNFVLPKGEAGFIRAKMVAQTLETFFASADEAIGTEHTPIWQKNNRGQKVLVEHQEKLKAVQEAKKIWEKMQLPNETRQEAYRMTHDGYLKLWQLTKPCLSSYDVIFVDEAQDCTPAVIDIVLSQACGKIFVGDPHQQIYSFRGAVSALHQVQHTRLFYLTQSFRFGAEIAYVGATILDICKNVKDKTLVGVNKEGGIRDVVSGQVALLSRTNACVFDEAVKVTEGDRPARIHLIGGPKNFGLDRIQDIWILLQPEEERKRQCLFIKDVFIKMWVNHGGFGALKQYAANAEDKELEAKIAVVEKYNIRIPELVNRLCFSHTQDPECADYILGTVHKAKGMEFETVHVSDDFVKVPCARHNLQRLPFRVDLYVEDEWNLLYVAVTRAKKHLMITKSIENLLTLAGEYFLRPELTGGPLREGKLTCAVTECSNAMPEEPGLLMRKLPITYSDKKEDKGGYLCHACIEQRIGPMTYLLATPSLVKSMEYATENLMIPLHIAQLLDII
ncbi:F-box DNA helicase 1 isoform X2 [Rhinatrema bivittatum]|uniref:F-box DNA helicase 1 isoform X2 n=1 Tax=Rhinatrema bivittatum TaxID=194408 RepID=UPI00112C5201|nr:F-box DNA helicase 1 isoform X2 [Rhinatrema bivittatum]